MKFDIIGSIILTLILMLIVHIFNLGFFGCIFLMIGAFIILGYRNVLLWHLSNITGKFKKDQKKEVKSFDEHMNL
jgi:hypothetical protein